MDDSRKLTGSDRDLTSERTLSSKCNMRINKNKTTVLVVCRHGSHAEVTIQRRRLEENREYLKTHICEGNIGLELRKWLMRNF